jgi:glycosyltransferase involved in cell wall biosynthesis
MIVKDEAALLAQSIKSAAPFISEIIVTDTGSADKTKKIAAELGAKVFDFAWTGDFSDARNFSAAQAANDWILVLDADECLTSFDEDFVKDFMKNPFNIGSIAVNSAAKDGQVFRERISRFYNRQNFYFAGSIHEQLVSFSGASVMPREIPVEADHSGYSPTVLESKNKLERNRVMLEKELAKNPEDPYYLYQMGKAYFAMPDSNLEAARYFEKALVLAENTAYSYIMSAAECYGYALIRSGQYEKSMELFKYEGAYGKNPNFRFMLAHVYLNNGKFSDALEAFESCLGKEGGYPGVGTYLSYYNIGVILETAGIKESAAAYYGQCGDYPPAAEGLKRLLS